MSRLRSHYVCDLAVRESVWAAERPVHEDNVVWTLRGQHVVRSTQPWSLRRLSSDRLRLSSDPLEGGRF